MKILYLDCFSGISGDMAVAALLDLGISLKILERELVKLGLKKEYRLEVKKGNQQGVTGLKFNVHTRDPEWIPPGARGHAHSGKGAAHHHHHSLSHDHSHEHHPHVHGRDYAAIRKLIQKSRLAADVEERALNVFHRIAVAEAKIHGVKVDRVHFHEVGGVDSIIDVVAASFLFLQLKPERILASSPVEGHGFVKCAHGSFPVPTAATLEILKGIPFRQIDLMGELITPTGAALLAEFVDSFEHYPAMAIERIGYGLGSRIYPGHPNVLRVSLGDARGDSVMPLEKIVVFETHLDDQTPEIIAGAMERLQMAGARDVYLGSVRMKKGRLGHHLTVLCMPEDQSRLLEILIRETGTLGVRIREEKRICLDREIRKLKIRSGTIKIKVGMRAGKIVSAKPEYDSCLELANQRKLPLRMVWTDAVAACSKWIHHD